MLADSGYQRALGQPWPVENAIWAGWRGQVLSVREGGRERLALAAEAAAGGNGSRFRCHSCRPSSASSLTPPRCSVISPAAEAALAEAERFTAESATSSNYGPRWLGPGWPPRAGELSSAVTLALELANQAEARPADLPNSRAARRRQTRPATAGVRHTSPASSSGLRDDSPHVYAAHVAALVAQDGAALDEVATAFASIGVNLLAAEAAAEAAHAYRATGRASRALAATRGPATRRRHAKAPTHRHLTSSPSHRILPLASGDRRTRRPRADEPAIAERLVISVRTVDNALQHVYGKLGLTGGAELRIALSRSDPRPVTSHPSSSPPAARKDE